MNEFLDSLRLGIDFGEDYGGIALVQANRVLHAETFVDFHQATLKDRRRNRRGRRTRHARKMRLARLRSWILRQKLPGGQRLPDPYGVMHWPFKTKKGHTIKTGLASRQDGKRTIIQKCKIGTATPEEFVCSLTLLFQKRGFVWEGSDLCELSDQELAEELMTVRITEAVAAAIKEEIERRKKEPEDNKEGEIENLETVLCDAVKRARSPRTPEHRSIVESDLKDIVDGWTRKNCPQMTDMWKKELSCLLNKHVRPARFENRIVAGCSWCGKMVPRKSKVRELAYKVVVKNIRVEDFTSRQPLTAQEAEYFSQLWVDKEAKPPARTAIENKLKKLKASPKMANQLYELLAPSEPKGHTNLCQQHLEMAARGAFMCNRHHAICENNNGDHQTIDSVKEGRKRAGPRNPCREDRDRRMIRRLEQILFETPGKPGKPSHSIPRLITIEFPKPNTAQTAGCPHCKEKLSLDARVRWKMARPMKLEASNDSTPFFCPSCAAGIKITLYKKMRIKEKEIVQKYSPKDTDVLVRKTAAGGLKKLKYDMYLKETDGTCVYCGTSIGSGQIDHIFPQSRGGPNIDYNLISCCRTCNGNLKKNKSPWEWFGNIDQRWREFEDRVKKLPAPQRKKAILLSRESAYPENPTALARVGARTKEFIGRIKQMLLANGVKENEIADNYEKDKIVIQTIDGWMTSRLRGCWRTFPDGTANFPPKNDADKRNHAQDAVLIAACPPHTWRERIFTWKPENPYFSVLQKIAPRWKDHQATMKILGRYFPRWHNQNSDIQFVHQHKTQNGTSYTMRDTVESIDVGTDKKGGSIERIYSKSFRDFFSRTFKSLGIKMAMNEIPKLKSQWLNERRAAWMKKNPATPVPNQRERAWEASFPRRLQFDMGYGEDVAEVNPKNGPSRFVRAQPVNDRIEVWTNDVRQAQIRTVKNRILFRHIQDNSPQGRTLERIFRRNDMIQLDAVQKRGRKGITGKSYEAGEYMVVKIEKGGKFTAVPAHRGKGRENQRQVSQREIAKLCGVSLSPKRRKPSRSTSESG
ncbi:MAG: hypothetical protein A3I06_03980 [Candidatus Lindowbacteria bacterium RIFCSPLOWO2_02_FULL_62_12]|nr:MAG: hypothetical protein A3I06_03980 [Candidatus Lindowbacteria bacterium RIFCSPLOWO2_02_FULL_62_12]